MTVKEIAQEIIEILQYFVDQEHAVVIPHKYFSDRNQSLQTLGKALAAHDQQLTNDLFVGVVTKHPSEALRHARRILAEYLP